MNTPNKITILRILLVPFITILLLCTQINNRFVYAFITFLIAAYTDHLDGKIARKRNSITDFGKFADPLADKALVMSSFICFVSMGEMSAIAVIVILIREFSVMSIRLVSAKGGKVISASFWGKAKTISQMITILFIILLLAVRQGCGEIIYPYNIYSNFIKEVFIWSSVILSWVSGIIYIRDNYHFIKNFN